MPLARHPPPLTFSEHSPPAVAHLHLHLRRRRRQRHRSIPAAASAAAAGAASAAAAAAQFQLLPPLNASHRLPVATANVPLPLKRCTPLAAVSHHRHRSLSTPVNSPPSLTSTIAATVHMHPPLTRRRHRFQLGISPPFVSHCSPRCSTAAADHCDCSPSAVPVSYSSLPLIRHCHPLVTRRRSHSASTHPRRRSLPPPPPPPAAAAVQIRPPPPLPPLPLTFSHRSPVTTAYLS